MTKSIAYAYPTSTNAMKAGKHGCYYVQGWTDTGVRRISANFDTIAAAEAFAEDQPEPWAPEYVRLPLRGSKFWKGT